MNAPQEDDQKIIPENEGGPTSAVMRPRARIISLIGEELISDEPVAIVELVKNSYDADAKNVTVRFEGEDPDHPNRVVVEDDGIGMNLDTVLSAWFEPGTLFQSVRKNDPLEVAYIKERKE